MATKTTKAEKAVKTVAEDTVTVPGTLDDVRIAEQTRANEIARKRVEQGDQRSVQQNVPLRNQLEPMTTRWANTSISGRAYELVEKGWLAVRYDELVNPGHGEFGKSPDGLVTRGAGGHLVLYKMPTAVYREIESAKSARERRRLASRQQMSAGAANASGHDQAGSAIARIGIEEFNVSRETQTHDADE